MPIITGGNVITGAPPVAISGSTAPVAGTAEVQTLTIGGTPTGGTFRLKHGPFVTANITWTAVDATLVTAIDTALEALPSIGASGVVVADTTITSGIGDVTLTFANKRVEHLVSVNNNSLTGSSPTVVVVETTPGVNPSGTSEGGSVPIGGQYTALDTGIVYVNTGTALSPTWTKVGAQT